MDMDCFYLCQENKLPSLLTWTAIISLQVEGMDEILSLRVLQIFYLSTESFI